MEKIILFYKFVSVPDPETVMFWQRQLCERNGLKGRVIIANHGINGTLGGSIEGVKAYVREMNKHPLFKRIEYKWSDGSANDFPKLSIKVRTELVTLSPGEQFDVFNRGKGLRPKAWHAYLKDHPDAIVLDARNDYESEIGVFKVKNLVKPQIKNFRDIKPEIEKLPRDKPILTYCTGDIRCEYLSAYMKHKGFNDVYHLDGGIVKYGQEFKDDGLWEGKCFVFDKRLSVGFSDASKDVGACIHCGNQTSLHQNCATVSCNRLVLVCADCASEEYCEQCVALQKPTATL